MLTRKDLESLWCRATTLDDATTPLPMAIIQELFDSSEPNIASAPADCGEAVSVDDAVEALDQLIADLDVFKAAVAGWVPAPTTKASPTEVAAWRHDAEHPRSRIT